MKLLISIIPKDIHDEVAHIVGGFKLDFQTTIPGKGTATSEILEYFSLGETERDVIISLIDDDDIQLIFDRLKEELDFLDSGRGVAFTISVDAISKLGYKFLYQDFMEVQSNGK